MTEREIAILDNGSGFMKAGIAGEEAPTVYFPAIVGRPDKNLGKMISVQSKDLYVGDEAIKMKGVCELNYPISNGIVQSWEDMETVWHHTFMNELRVDPKDLEGVLLTEAPRNPKKNREKMCEVMFESFEVNNMYVAIQAVMSLYAAGRTTGLVVDCGDGVSHTVPVFEGFSLPHAVEKMEIAGRELSNYLQKLLLEAGHSFTGSASMQIVNDIKEKTCYVAQNYAEEREEAKKSSEHDTQYKLPDNQVIDIPATVRMGAPELFFDPSKNGKSCMSLPALAWSSITKSDIDTRKDLCRNVIMSGGSTLFEGIADRFKRELINLAPSGAEVRLTAQADRKYAVFKGASTLASLSTFGSSWVTREDYQEHGSEVIVRKCN